MTKEETIKIMAMLGAFYSGGKNDPKVQAMAWHLILSKYDYRVAEAAVLHFAENDKREYATFPTVGTIVAEIKQEEKRRYRPIQEIIRAVSYGDPYSKLSAESKSLIDKEQYRAWLCIDALEFAERSGEFAKYLQDKLQGRADKCLSDNTMIQTASALHD